ncbi:unnamed protein product, partial [Thlaspi arvense]
MWAIDPNFSYAFCVKSLESDPQSKTATNLQRLLIASIKNSANINIYLSAAFDAPTDCEDGFKEIQQAKSPITNKNNILTQMIFIPLALSNM